MTVAVPVKGILKQHYHHQVNIANPRTKES